MSEVKLITRREKLLFFWTLRPRRRRGWRKWKLLWPIRGNIKQN